jgi:hypothetical protein
MWNNYHRSTPAKSSCVNIALDVKGITRLLLRGQLYCVRTNGIQKIGRMRRDDENVVIR